MGFAIATVVSAEFTYRSDVSCRQSFCDSFFDDNSICQETGSGSAIVFEGDDGSCGIRITSDDVEVTCSVRCHNQSNTWFFVSTILILIVSVLTLLCGCISICLKNQRRNLDMKVPENLAEMEDGHASLSLGAKERLRDIASGFRFMSSLNVESTLAKYSDQDPYIVETEHLTRQSSKLQPGTPLPNMIDEGEFLDDDDDCDDEGETSRIV